MTGLQPYPAYGDSGVEWLGTIPEHWCVVRGKKLFRCMDIRSATGEEELLTVSSDRGVVPRTSATVSMFKAKSYVGHKLCWPGDLVINSLWAWSRGLGVSKHHGIVSTAYGVYRVRRRTEASTAYVHALVRSTPFRWELRVRSKGIWISRLQMTDESFLGAPFPLPPIEEQTAIARFLDHADRRIQRYIRAKERLIELLEEQKQAIIHQAVTGQIDVRTGQPYPAYKDSGVEWLGEVPEHWEVRRLRYLVEGKLAYGANAAAEYTNKEWPRYLRITDFGPDGRLRSQTFRSLPPEIAKDYLVEPGDVLLARSGATVGKAFLVGEESGGACYAGYLIRARPHRGRLLPGFLFVFTQSSEFRRWKDLTLIIATIENIGADKYAGLPIPTPPVSEQQRILRFIDLAGGDLDRAAKRATSAISLLREYRTRLIADVVTGKVDVRDAAATLHDPLAAEDTLNDPAEPIAEPEPVHNPPHP